MAENHILEDHQNGRLSNHPRLLMGGPPMATLLKTFIFKTFIGLIQNLRDAGNRRFSRVALASPSDRRSIWIRRGSVDLRNPDPSRYRLFLPVGRWISQCKEFAVLQSRVMGSI